jgi:hypothetical protein
MVKLVAIKRRVVIHIILHKLQFSSEMPLAYVTFVTTVLILLLPEHIRIALVHYWSISRPMFLLPVFIVLGQFSVVISGSPCMLYFIDVILSPSVLKYGFNILTLLIKHSELW